MINEKCDWNGTMFPFKGTKDLQEEKDKEESNHSDFDDEEWSASNSKCTIKLNNALGALMGAYMSGSDSEEEKTVKQPLTNNLLGTIEQITTKPGIECERKQQLQQQHQISDDDSPPTEVKIVKEQSLIKRGDDKSKNIIENNSLKLKRKRPHFKQKNKNKKNNNFSEQMSINRSGGSGGFPYKFKRRKVSLLEKLLENEIRHERNVILQCVRYAVSNNFFIKD